MSIKTIKIDDVEYVRKDDIKSLEKVEDLNGMPYMMVRTYSAGVFAGYVKQRNGKEGVIVQARRMFYWEGAASLSQLATEGPSKPEKCKFPCPVSEVHLTEIIELIPITAKAKKSIDGVKEWKC